jgi:short-subunit dehydrogenase
MELKNKLMLITGASSGIGAATAMRAADAGADVILLARNQARLQDITEQIRARQRRAYVYALDLTDAPAVESIAPEIIREIGVPDVIFNNAGAGKWQFIEETNTQDAVAMMASPYFAAFFLTRQFLPAMLKRNSGYIVNMTSLAGHMAWPGATAYTAARWAMRGFTEALRADLAGTNIRVALATFAKISSAYWDHNAGSEDRVPKAQASIPVLTPEQAAAEIISGIQNNRAEIFAPFMLKMILLLNTWFPQANRQAIYASGYKRARA